MKKYLVALDQGTTQRHNCTNRAERTPSPSPREGRDGIRIANAATDGENGLPG